MIQKSDVDHAVNLIKGIGDKAKSLATTGNPLENLPQLLMLATDTEAVAVAYANDLRNLLPAVAGTPFPKSNLFNQLSWVGKNLVTLIPLFSGVDPFADARHLADALAAKYGITE